MNDFPERPRLVWEPSAAYVRAASLVETFAADCERVWSFGMDQTMRQRLHMLVLDALETPFRGREPSIGTADPAGFAPTSEFAMVTKDPRYNVPEALQDVADAIARKPRAAKGRKKRRKAKVDKAPTAASASPEPTTDEEAPPVAKRGRGRPKKAKAVEAQPEGEPA